MMQVNTCFPVQSGTGFKIAGIGTSTSSSANPKYATNEQNISFEKNWSLCVIKYAALRKSCEAATSGSPFLGVARL